MGMCCQERLVIRRHASLWYQPRTRFSASPMYLSEIQKIETGFKQNVEQREDMDMQAFVPT